MFRETSGLKTHTMPGNGASRETDDFQERERVKGKKNGEWVEKNDNEWIYRTTCEGCDKEFRIGLTVSAVPRSELKDRLAKIETERFCAECRGMV